MEKRDKLFKLYCNESDRILRAFKPNYFKMARNSVISTIKKSKNNIIDTIFETIPKTLKNYTSEITSILTLKAKVKTSLNGVTVTNKKSFAETFNHFLSILIPILHRKSQKQYTCLINI